MSKPAWDDYSDMIGHINKCEARIEALEAALREIAEGPPTTEDEAERAIIKMRVIARDALAPEQDK